ncbi:type III pantothenate kinase [Herbaspirillum sp. RTI4]|uniref:type III pantothenate kinase n=1 Tax=Herbaspirillum sp. RTI4 TaxID=3048640 RepID=UPI002AB39B6A|nr:type III pantothenate kinase [Herbaspirillum sp. RTI4]MDY7576941.1 type III pantothenate kinase [Herbaspirillum sp. RTI4]MEA9982157.1 type III pantothenate kinase [Herbaspirillum sp. RTI4]
MLLLIDIGNTRLKWAIAPSASPTGDDGRRWLHSGALAHHAMEQMPALLQQHPIRRVLISNVAGHAVRAALDALLTPAVVGRVVEVQWFASSAALAGVRNGYRDPLQLGCDRFASAIGAHALYPGEAMIVVNAGTATTIDALTADGRFLGGMILPGLDLMTASLAKGTAQLPQVASDAGATGPLTIFADNTRQAILAGCLQAQTGAIEAAVATHAATGGDKVRCLVSGGSAASLLPNLRIDAEFVEQLVLIGLHEVALCS